MSVHDAYFILFETTPLPIPTQFDDHGTHSLNWRPYDRPSQPENLEKCQETDRRNLSVWLENRKCGDRMYALIDGARFGVASDLLVPPVSYTQKLKELCLSRLRSDAHYACIVAMHYLFRRHGMRAFMDYAPEKAVVLAEADAEEREIETRCRTGVFVQQHAYCGCNGEWDGRSTHCVMGKGPLRWERAPDFTFASPSLLARNAQ